jgi:ankyrin repeat protein
MIPKQQTPSSASHAEENFMQVDGVDDDPHSDKPGPTLKQNPDANTDHVDRQQEEQQGQDQQRGYKRAWRADSPPAQQAQGQEQGQAEDLPSTEPVAKKRRTQEAAIPEPYPAAASGANSTGTSSSASSSSSSSSSSTALATDIGTNAAAQHVQQGWQQSVCSPLSSEDLQAVLDCFTAQKNPEKGLSLLFGSFYILRPIGHFSVRQLANMHDHVGNLLIECGAVILGRTTNDNCLVMTTADFNTAKFRDGLIAMQAQDIANGTQTGVDGCAPRFMIAAEWGDVSIAQALLTNGAAPNVKDARDETALMSAISSGQIAMVRLLLAHPHDINAVDKNKWSALSLAAAGGNVELCQLLLEHGASLTIEEAYKPLTLAAERDHAEVCTFLVQQGDVVDRIDQNRTALHWAALNGHLAACKALLLSGAAINLLSANGISILTDAAQGCNLELFKYLLAQGAQLVVATCRTTPLVMAAEKNHTGILQFLLTEKKVDVNQRFIDDHTALMRACHHGSMAAAILLLAHGARADLMDVTGNSALIYAASGGQPGLITLLLTHDASLLTKNNAGFLALRAAITGQHLSAAQCLLQAGAPTEPVIIIGSAKSVPLLITAVHTVKHENGIAILSLLLQHGVSLRRVDKRGNDALMLATGMLHFEAMQLLINAGAKIGQINKKGQNALQIVVDALDKKLQGLDHKKKTEEDEALLVLLTLLMKQPNWTRLRKDALNAARHLITREIILLDWAWPLDNSGSIQTLAYNQIQLTAFQSFIKDAITTPAFLADMQHSQTMLGLSGICPALIDHFTPYLTALPLMKPHLFGNAQPIHDLHVHTLIAGMAMTLEREAMLPEDAWLPYEKYLLSVQTSLVLDQVAAIERHQFIQLGLQTESNITAPAFENLFQTCLGFSLNNLAVPFYSTASDAMSSAMSSVTTSSMSSTLSSTLIAQSIYAALAHKIEIAWQADWAAFIKKQPALGVNIAPENVDPDPFGLWDDDDTPLEYLTTAQVIEPAIANAPIALDALTSPDSPQAQELLQLFRTELQNILNTPGQNILALPAAAPVVAPAVAPADLPDAAPAFAAPVSPAVAQAYSDLMFRQLHMLIQFINQ